jgi:hypothetical protein
VSCQLSGKGDFPSLGARFLGSFLALAALLQPLNVSGGECHYLHHVSVGESTYQVSDSVMCVV